MTRLLISLHASYLLNERGTLSISTEIAFFLAQMRSKSHFTSVSSDVDITMMMADALMGLDSLLSP